MNGLFCTPNTLLNYRRVFKEDGSQTLPIYSPIRSYPPPKKLKPRPRDQNFGSCVSCRFFGRSLKCDRQRVHKNFMVSLVIRYVVSVVWYEPYIYGQEQPSVWFKSIGQVGSELLACSSHSSIVCSTCIVCCVNSERETLGYNTRKGAQLCRGWVRSNYFRTGFECEIIKIHSTRLKNS